MSKSIDQRVVEMQFDNRQFESNVKTSLSTLDKLKQSLNFKDAGKGFENISSAAKKVDMTGLGKTVDAVAVKFSSLQVVATTALANITNSVVNTGKSLVNSLTLEPVMTGFSEYELKLNSIQTIMANTASKGTTMSDVTAALDELNTYADQTIYNFAEMTRNIGTFTAAGVDLDKSVTSIKGIANLAAISGSNAQQASTAMYQLSQALAAGRVSLMDWNSVVNAGMGGEVFQNALKRTAEQMGHNVDALIEKYGSFRESLTQGQWLTADVLTETLTQLSGAYSEADLIAQGYTEQQAKEIVELANTAVNAATKVKTFTQLFDTMKESVQSGWAQSWEIIIGDFEEAKESLTEMSDIFGDFVSSGADSRNAFLTKSLSSSWKQLSKEISAAGIDMTDFQEKLVETGKKHGVVTDEMIEKAGGFEKSLRTGWASADIFSETLKSYSEGLSGMSQSTDEMTAKLEEFQKVVRDVWMGDYKNGQERVEALTKAGYDYATVQDLVNKTVDGHKLTLEDLNIKQAANLGFTKEQIKVLEDLASQAEKTGTPINELINNLTRPSGRELLLDSLKNSFEGLLKVITTVREAFSNVFPANPESLYNLVSSLHEFTESLVMSDETADKLRRTLEGIFAILDIVGTLASGPIKIALQILSTLLGAADLDVLSLTASIGDVIVAFRDWIDEHNLLANAIEFIIPPIKNAIDAISSWVNSLKESENLPRDIASGIVEGFGSAISFAKESVDQLISLVLNGFSEIPDGIASGFVGGIQNGMNIIGDTLIALGQMILDKIKGVLGIHSPSTEFFEIGENIISGLANGLKSGFSTILSVVQSIGSQILSVLGNIDWGTVFAALLSAGGMITLYKFASALSSLTFPLEGLGDILEGFGGILKSFSGTIKAFNFKTKAEGIKTFATAIAILAGSVVVLSLIDPAKLWNAVGVIAALSAVIAGLSLAIDKFGSGNIIDAAKISGLLLALSSSFLLLAATMKIISGMSWDDLTKASAGLMALGLVITGLVAATKIGGKEVEKAGSTILKLSVAMGALVLVSKMIAGMSWENMGKAAVGLSGLTIIVGALVAVTRVAGNKIDEVGGTILKLSIAMAALVLVSKMIAGMSWENMGKAAVGLTGLSAIVGILIAITKLAGPNADKIGSTILKLSIAMGSLVLVSKMIAGMSWENMGKAAVGLTGLSVVVGILVGITKLASDKELAKLGTTLLMLSASIGILGGISVLLGMVKTENLVKGVTAVGVLSLLMSTMIVATKFATGSMGNLVVITVAIGILAAAAATLSFIDPAKLMTATTALSMLMGMFALMAAASGSATAALGAMVTMTLVVSALAGILYLLSGLPVENALAVSASLSTILLAFSASLLIISKAGVVAPTALVALGVMTLITGGLGAILVLLSGMNPGPTLEIATSLSVLLLSLSAVCLILSAVGATGPAALIGVGIFSAVVVAIGGLMAGIGALITYFPQLETFVTSGIDLLNKVAYGIGSFIGSLIGGFGSGLTSGLPDIGTNLSEFMANAQGFIDGASGIDPAAFDGISALAGAIVTLTAANIVEAIGSWLTGGSSLSDFAKELVPFGESMVEFSNSLSGLNSDLVSNAATAGKTLAEMAATLPNSGGIVGWFTGENDMSSFGDQLVSFGEAMVEYSNAVSGLDANAVTNSAVAGKALAELAKSIPNSGGLAGIFAGENDIDDFGSKIVPFGQAIKEYSLEVAGLDSNAVVNSAVAGKALTELADTIPNTGGLVSFLTGDNDFATFGTQLASFGKSMVEYSTSVSGLNTGAVEASASVGSMLVELADTIPNTGGLISFFSGDNDLASFGEKIVSFGWSMSAYSFAVSALDVDAITRSVTAASQLSELASSLETSGGFFSLFTGDANLSTFGKSLQDFGQALSNYATSVSTIDSGSLSSVISQVYRLIAMAERTSGLDTSGLTSFGQGLKELAKADIDGLISVYTDSYDRVRSAVQGLVNALSSGVTDYQTTFVSSVSSMITESLASIDSKTSEFNVRGISVVSNFVSGADSKKVEGVRVFDLMIQEILNLISQNGVEFQDSGSKLVSEFISGIKSEEKEAASSFDYVMSSMLSSIRSEYNGFYEAGKYLVVGFANGITDSAYLAKAKAQAMAQAAKVSAESTLGIHSPSKVFYGLGIFVVEGFANGIQDNVFKVSDASEELGESATDATKESLEVKNGTSELAKKVIGEAFVKGIAEGITSDMSAEEAAEKKAENIVTAFEKALSKFDISSSKIDLESQLWDALGENIVSESQRDEAKLQLLLKEYENQTKRLELAKAEYQTMVDEFGEQSEQAQESYNRLLQQQLDAVEIFNQIADLKEEQAEREGDAFDKQEEQLEREYDILSQSYGKTLSVAEKELLDLALLTDRYQLQVEKANSAKANYEAMVRAFGEHSTKALEAYDKYLEAYQEQTKLASELESSRKDQLNYGSSSYDRYIDYLKAKREEMLIAQGVSSEDAEKQVNEAFSNFTPSKDLDKLIESIRDLAKNSFSQTAEDSQVAYKETADKTFGLLTQDFEEYGEKYAESLQNGFTSSSSKTDIPSIVLPESSDIDLKSVSDTANQIKDAISSITKDSETLKEDVSVVFNGVGQSVISGFISGMQAELSNVGDLSGVLSDMLENITKEMTNTLYSGGALAYGTIDPESAPEMAKPLLVFFQTLGDSIQVLFTETYSETWIAIGSSILESVQQGAEEQKEIFEEWIDAFCQFFYDVIKEHQPVFFEAGVYVVTEFAAGLSFGAQQAILTAQSIGGAIAGALAGGFSNGMSMSMDQIKDAVQAVTDTAIGQMQNALQIHSPSRVTMRFGSYFAEGFARGISDGERSASIAALSMVQDTISKIADAVDAGMDVEPTIRPVLDLSSVEAESKRLNAIFSRNRAMSINRDMYQPVKDNINQNGETVSETGSTFNFTQNNYSPKALSRADIYRQTKNQISTLKRMVRV